MRKNKILNNQNLRLLANCLDFRVAAEAVSYWRKEFPEAYRDVKDNTSPDSGIFLRRD
jgi:hypothetical protein